MEMTHRQFARSIAAATTLRSSLFELLFLNPRILQLVFPRGVVPGRVTWAHDLAAVTWDGTGSDGFGLYPESYNLQKRCARLAIGDLT
jgi:hypothetical protein